MVVKILYTFGEDALLPIGQHSELQSGSILRTSTGHENAGCLRGTDFFI